MTSRTPSERASDIVAAVADIQSDIGGLSMDEFLADGKSIRAVITSISNIGEAAGALMTLMPGLQTTAPDIWDHLRKSRGMRNILAHKYFGTSADLVWNTVKLHLPEFASLLQSREGLFIAASQPPLSSPSLGSSGLLSPAPETRTEDDSVDGATSPRRRKKLD